MQEQIAFLTPSEELQFGYDRQWVKTIINQYHHKFMKNFFPNSFLAAGDSFNTLAYQFRLGASTVRAIVKETCDVIWEVLSPSYLPEPNKNELQVAFGTDGIFTTAFELLMASMSFYKHHLNLVACSSTTKAHFQ